MISRHDESAHATVDRMTPTCVTEIPSTANPNRMNPRC